METTFDVRVWTTQVRKNKQGKVTSYRVRWQVGGEPFGKSFSTSTLADGFRARLVTAARNGEPFCLNTGLPVSQTKNKTNNVTWYQAACEYADMKWPDSAPKYRRSIAQSLTAITVPMLDGRNLPDPKLLRKALTTAFNPRSRNGELQPDIRQALTVAAKASRNVSELTNPDTLRAVLRALDLKLDGNRASANTVRLRRITLRNAIDFFIEKKYLDSNPLQGIKVKKRKVALRQVDPKSVCNPMQGRMLISAVGMSGKQGPPLEAFFGSIYYAALRPEEAGNLKESNLDLPPPEQDPVTGEVTYGWGDINLDSARPEISGEWTDSGEAGEAGPLKHRERGVGRPVPCPPPLTELFYRHLTRFGTAPDGRLFRGARDGGLVSSSVYGRVWAAAREQVFTAEVAAGPLAKRPYDLRAAAVSTQLNSGVSPMRVAEWAGHSLSVLLRVYARCLDGGDQADRAKLRQNFTSG
ncbi:tyrosine-type recombinase/integrase [Amycolatopsis cihanbeyliensis]|uniref:Tyr recombinase domain-containing protein n=1 Tax=Amycolatopsis cihanbeyliensis TaxID=1128664 RepID=A0A542DJK8_AMYCI|nr:integrase [Amycolatopsis cihanbeyliensis]TQJ03273.1 hypothetical protein FB471_3028 [Amycolatopsis cihanbeyliensis]